MVQIWRSFCLLSLLTLALGGCTTIVFNSSSQYVPVSSEPEGAKIYSGSEALGTTPQFIEVKRRSNAYDLKLVYGHEQKEVQLESKYRWLDSFGSDFVFLSVAPIAWGLDLGTGTAWDFETPDVVQFSERKHSNKKESHVIAIAPPKAKNFSLSDQVGKAWSKKMAALYPHDKILPYETTLQEFTDAYQEYDSSPDLQALYRVYGRLNVEYVLESEVTATEAGLSAVGKLKNVFRNEVKSEIQLQIPTSTEVAPTRLAKLSQSDKWHIIPDTVGVQFTSSNLTLSVRDQTFYSNDVRDGGISSVAPYLSSIILTHLTQWDRGDRLRFRYQFFPAVTLSYRHVNFPNYTPITDTDFKYLQISAGYGAEGGFQYNRHYVYIDLVYFFGYQQLKWSQAGMTETQSMFGATTRAELGYMYFMSHELSLRLFTRSDSTDSDGLWYKAINKIHPGAGSVGSADLAYGLGLNYTFQ